MPSVIAAIDQGTTSTRCLLFDHAGQVLGIAQREHRQIYPQAGWVEHDAVEIWECTQDVIQEVLQKKRLSPSDIIAVGITNQRETTLVWNRESGEPYCHAIVWQDTRTKDLCDQLAADGSIDRFRDKVGLPLSTYFSGPKIQWMLDNIPGLRADAERGEAIFGNIDSWLIWWLTGGPGCGSHVTDVTNASRTMLMNLTTLDWDMDILKVFGIPHQMLPRITPSSDPQSWGATTSDGPFGVRIPVCGNLGDQQAALLGQACFDPGEAKNTYGTGCFMLLNTGVQPIHSHHGLLTTLAYQLHSAPAVYALEGSIAIAGALVQWLRDNLGLIRTSRDIETLALSVPDSGGIYIVPAFSGLFAPYWRTDARGVIVGLTRYVTAGHLARATLEATAYQTLEVLDAMQKDSGITLSSLKVDGGMVSNEYLMQFQADLLNVPVIRPKVTETTALGAAYAAGLAVNFWNDLRELRANWQMDKSWTPGMPEVTRDRLIHGWQKAVARTLDWVD